MYETFAHSSYRLANKCCWPHKSLSRPGMDVVLQVVMLLNATSDLGDNTRCLVPGAPTICYYWHLRVFRRELVHMRQQSYHTKETGYGKDVDGCRRLLANVDLLVSDVVHHSESLRRSLSVSPSDNCGESRLCRVCGGSEDVQLLYRSSPVGRDEDLQNHLRSREQSG